MIFDINTIELFGLPFSIEFVVLAALLLVSLIIQLIYQFYYLKIVYQVNNDPMPDKFPLSVIICARNEAVNLQKNLPLVLEQDYPDFEVIVVNDCSEDDTEMVLAELKLKYKHLKSTNIAKDKKFTHGKKLALTVGIKGAQHEWLVLTDADCKPAGKNWLYSFQRYFTNDASIVIGYGGYRHRKGLLDKVIRYETVYNAMQYLGLALARKPYMAVGRNLAYRKSLFFENKGFASHSHILSGDDDLFVNQVATRENTRVVTEKENFTISEPVKSWKRWFYQKKRHLTTFSSYKQKSKFNLGLELVSRFLFYGSFVALLVLGHFLPYILGVFGLRLIVQLSVFKSVMRRLNEKYLLLFSPIMDVIVPFINFIAVISNNIGSKSNRW